MGQQFLRDFMLDSHLLRIDIDMTTYAPDIYISCKYKKLHSKLYFCANEVPDFCKFVGFTCLAMNLLLRVMWAWVNLLVEIRN